MIDFNFKDKINLNSKKFENSGCEFKYTKMVRVEDQTLHLMPFIPSRKRIKNYRTIRKWKNLSVEITARESLNIHDFINFCLLLGDYQTTEWGKVSLIVEGKEMRIAIKIIDIEKVCKVKGVKNKKTNRKSFYDSLGRWADTSIRHLPRGEHSQYIFQVNDASDANDYKKVIIFANAKFFDFCLENGIYIDQERILKYLSAKTGRYKEHAILLDFYLQSTKENSKGKWYYRRCYNLEELFNATHLDEQNTQEKEKIRVLKESFKIINKIGGLPLYIFDKNKKTFCREDIEKIQRNFARKIIR